MIAIWLWILFVFGQSITATTTSDQRETVAHFRVDDVPAFTKQDFATATRFFFKKNNNNSNNYNNLDLIFKCNLGIIAMDVTYNGFIASNIFISILLSRKEFFGKRFLLFFFLFHILRNK